MGFAGIARQAWELPEGTHEHRGFRVVRNPRNVFLFVNPEGMLQPQAKLLSTAEILNHLDTHPAVLHLVAYPNPRHHEAFSRQSRLNRQGGYSEDYPEAIGTLSLGINPSGGLQVNYAQSHMAGSRNIETKHYLRDKFGLHEESLTGLSRSMREKYAGWRERAFREAIRLAIQKKTDLTVSKGGSELKRQFERSGQLMRDIKAAAEKEGVKISESEKEVRIITGEE